MDIGLFYHFGKRRRYFMKKVFLFITLILVLSSCTPTVLPTTSILVDMEIPVEFTVLESPLIHSELDHLIVLTENRTSGEVYKILDWYASPVVKWNEVTRDWVSFYYRNPPIASRAYAIVSVAQQRALDEVHKYNINLESRFPKTLNNEVLPVEIGCEPFECAVLIGVAESTLLYLFPETKEAILNQVEEARQSLILSGNILPSDLDIGESFGRAIAQNVIAERINDGASTAGKSDPLPVGEGIWKPDPFQANPQAPSWGKVTPWLLASPDQFRSAPPPENGSPEFLTALDEVYQVQQTVTHEQLAIADYWAGNPGTFTPAGYWNLIASQLITEYKLSSVEAGHVFSTMNMAIMDSGIGCWDSKYHYLVVRPWQADERIRGLVGYPNHPSYPSGHSCFSSAGAEVLAFYFPNDATEIQAKAKEASISRLYGGIHYRFDLEAGLELGKQVSDLYIEFIVEQGWEIKP
ncbi:MAG TPA: hypothetical protein DIW23_06450 [Anaerolineae bacterium]|nr:hypothetical protein [Anaerolineae bacterium]